MEQKEYTLTEICQELNLTEHYFINNFCKVAKIRLKKGILIKRYKKNKEWYYQLEQVEPKLVDENYFSCRPKDNNIIEGEIWMPYYLSSDYEVSNHGRIRNATTKKIHCGTINSHGYRIVSINSQKFPVHRIVYQSFNPKENIELLTIDHINGKRSDNRLENLRAIPKEENTQYMLMERYKLNKELTRIINIYGYKKTLELLQSLK